ncbi:unannotated protein [freshwater metagenome]|uniref:Unannotated protein n=1 Tax=freshwater metagenome TaxID=449393 RepID=A0A6J6L9P5_9ZZZZ
MREVGTPEHVLDSDFVALSHLATLHIGKAGEAVAVDVLAREHFHFARERACTELLRALLSRPQAIPEPQKLRKPPATALGRTELEVRVALKDA